MHRYTGFVKSIVDDSESPISMVLCSVPGLESLARRRDVRVPYIGEHSRRAIRVVFD